MNRWILTITLAGLAALSILAGGGFALSPAHAAPRGQAAAAVRISDFEFTPKTLTITAGTTVTWTNAGNAPHTATADNRAFDSKTLNRGQTFSFKFDTPGTFAYHCDIHPSMTATIIVQPAAAAPPAPAATPAPVATPAPAARTATPARTPTATPAPAAATTPTPAAAHTGTHSATAAVKIVDFGFEPAALTVKAGTAVTWTNTGNAPHTATSDTKLFDSGRLSNGGSYSFTFDTPGTYAYKCEVHPARMSGTVVVEAAASAAAVAGGEQRGAQGVATFGDGQVPSDQVRLDVQNLQPQAGATITGWLTAGSGEAVRLGELKPDASGKASLTYTDAGRRNLIALYDRVVVTAESGSAGSRPAGRELMRDEVPAGGMVHIRHLLARFEETPKATALATGLLAQSSIAAEHAGLAKSAVQANDLAAVRLNLERLVNVIEGEKGANFGDRNGDERRDNPGDGFGVLTYATAASQHAQLAVDAAPRDETIKIHGGHVMVTTKNVSDWLTEARTAALPAFSAANAGAARGAVDRIAELLEAALDGRDANRDGRIDPIAGEGGARTTYNHAQLMATLEPNAASVETAPANGAPQAAVAPAPTAAPDDGGTQAAASSNDDGARLVLFAAIAAAVLVAALGVGAWFFTGRKRGAA